MDDGGIKRWNVTDGIFHGKPVTVIQLSPTESVRNSSTGKYIKVGHWFINLDGGSFESNKENVISAVYAVLTWFDSIEKPLLFVGATMKKNGYEWRKPYERADIEAFADKVLSDSVGLISYEKGTVSINAWFRPNGVEISIKTMYIDN
jgi:hypothetical protein